MHPEMKAEMAQEYHRELENMRERDTRTPPWELAALDTDGNELYRTEYAHSEEEAQRMADEADPSRHEGVASFEPRRTDG